MIIDNLPMLNTASFLADTWYISNWLQLQQDVANQAFLLLLVQFLPSLTITALNFIVPLVFQKMVLAEGYSPTMEIKITIFRYAGPFDEWKTFWFLIINI